MLINVFIEGKVLYYGRLGEKPKENERASTMIG
jgi:hypothetical protein